ncbi:MAG TPA: hypothetical protein VJR58_09595 [Vineibacter sp.]|nr:hypothetical protein [Vineibacter sp.]
MTSAKHGTRLALMAAIGVALMPAIAGCDESRSDQLRDGRMRDGSTTGTPSTGGYSNSPGAVGGSSGPTSRQ